MVVYIPSITEISVEVDERSAPPLPLKGVLQLVPK
jgi:hypothetical protein